MSARVLTSLTVKVTHQVSEALLLNVNQASGTCDSGFMVLSAALSGILIF